MLHVGTRSDPSVLRLVLTVLFVLVVAVYGIIALATGDLMWFNTKFAEIPKSIQVHCYGNTIDIDPGSYHFTALTELVNKGLSGEKYWDSLTLSENTYQDYRTHADMVAIEFFYHDAVRIHSNYKFYSSIDNIIIPIQGRHAQTYAVFGQNEGVPAGGSLHIESTKPMAMYLQNMELCAVPMTSE